MSSLLGSRGIIENGMGTEKLMEIFFFFNHYQKNHTDWLIVSEMLDYF